MIKHCIHGAATSWTQPAALTEIFGTTNRRRGVPASDRVRARVQVGGVVSGFSTAIIACQYTTDLTGATGWDYLDGVDGPQVPINGLNGNATQIGAWVNLVTAAKGNVLIRWVGVGGDGVVIPTMVTVFTEFSSIPGTVANSLAGGSLTSNVIAFFGGSQIGGGGTAGVLPGQFGVLDPTISAALDPLFLLGAGSNGVTYRKNGVTLTAAPTEHGAEIGYINSLRTAGKAIGKTLLCRFVLATKAQDWVSTHFATIAADAVTLGVVPKVACYILGGTDANSDATVGRLHADLYKLRSLVQTAWPGCVFVVMGQVTENLISFPKLVEARRVGQRMFEDTIRQEVCAWVDRTPVSALLQSDGDHPTSAGHVVQGGIFAAPALAYGLHG